MNRIAQQPVTLKSKKNGFYETPLPANLFPFFDGFSKFGKCTTHSYFRTGQGRFTKNGF
jgi:hypothetical protein